MLSVVRLGATPSYKTPYLARNGVSLLGKEVYKMQRAVLPGESSHSELVSESSTAGSNPLPLQTTVSSTRFAALPLSVQQLTNVASSMLGQAPQIVDSITPALQFSSIGSLVDQLNPPNAKQPRVEAPEQQAEPYEASADVDDDDEEKPVPKKTRGRVRIKMEYIQNKLRRYTTFSKRKSGLMKKVSFRTFAALAPDLFNVESLC